jgi:hypothetical protein
VDTTKLGVTEKVYASRNAMTYDKIRAQDINNITDGSATTNIQDFREWNAKPDNSWNNKTIDSRFYVAAGKYVDKMNESYPFLFKNKDAPWKTGDVTLPGKTDDLIKFVFECVSNDNLDFSLALFFRAFLTAGITDNNSAQLNAFKYAGRGENFYAYQGFERSIGFSFRVAAGSKEELFPMYNRLNALVSQVYPDYSSNGFMRAPLVKITIGDYLYRMPGLLENVNITVDNGTPWEINLDNKEDLAQLPQVVDVSVSFKPILSELPRRAYSKGSGVDYSEFSSVDPNTKINTMTSDITSEFPKIIANNDKVIKTSGLPYTYKTVANEEEINNQYDYEEEERKRAKANFENLIYLGGQPKDATQIFLKNE